MTKILFTAFTGIITMGLADVTGLGSMVADLLSLAVF